MLALVCGTPDFSHLLRGGNVCEVDAKADNSTNASMAFLKALESCRKDHADHGVVFFRNRVSRTIIWHQHTRP